MHVFDRARVDITRILLKTGLKIKASDLVFPPNAKMGDLSLPLFAVAKEQGVAPGKLAQELVKKLKPTGLVERVEAVGAYLNFWLKRREVVKMVITTLTPTLSHKGRGSSNKKSPSLGGRGEGRGSQRIMLEMISPNNNKPLHLGHLRNAFLGESVARLLESQGAKVVRACLYNDRGLHIAKAMLGYQLWGKDKTPESEQMKGDQFVVQWYVLFEQEDKKQETRNKKQSDLMEQAEDLVRKWEQGDKETLALWKKMAGWAMAGIQDTFKRLGLNFDALYFESKLWKQGKKIVGEGLKRGVFKKDETGVVIAEFFSTTKRTKMSDRTFSSVLPPKVLLRSDGTAIYATSDLALTPEKFKKYKLDRAIWCVGQEQNLYLQQLFAIMKMLGYKWTNQCEHLTYGLVHLPEGRMKTREGTVVEADPLLDHMVKLAREEIKTRHTHLTEQEIENRAEKIAQAAVRYYLLKVGPKQTVHFDPQASVAFTGDTGPYLLYTYARIASILRKSVTDSNLSAKGGRNYRNYGEAALRERSELITQSKLPMTDTEWHLILQLARFSEIITSAATDRDPSHLAKHLFNLAQQFSEFYEKMPVLQSVEPVRSFRLALIKKIQSTLKQGLRLLTIDTVEEM